MKHQGSRFIIEPSYVNIENLFLRLAYEDTKKSQAIYSDFTSAAMKHQGSQFIIEPSYVNIENLS